MRIKSSVLSPSIASLPLPWIQQLPTPRAEAIRCMLAMTTLQSSTQVSDSSSFPTTMMAASAPASIREDPFRRHPDKLISIFLSRTTIRSQGLMDLLEAEERPAMMIWLSFSIGTGSPV